MRSADRVAEEYDLLTHGKSGSALITGASRGWLVEGPLTSHLADLLMRRLFVDSLVETGVLGTLNEHMDKDRLATVLYKPGVMDPAALSVADAARDLGCPAFRRSFRRYYGPPLSPEAKKLLFQKVLANDAVEQVVEGPLESINLEFGDDYRFQAIVVPLRKLDDAALEKLSRDGQLSLSLAEMRTIQEHFRAADRDPTDVELETLAQTWSEHCSHKTLKGRIDFQMKRAPHAIDNLLKETIFARHAGDAPPPRRRRLVRQRLRGQRRRRSLRRPISTSASRWKRTIIRRPSNPTAAPTPAWAA